MTGILTVRLPPLATSPRSLAFQALDARLPMLERGVPPLEPVWLLGNIQDRDHATLRELCDLPCNRLSFRKVKATYQTA